MTQSTATQPEDGDGNEEYPLLALQTSPEALAIMLDDIRHDLGLEVISFLRQTKCLGRVVAVLLECKAAGHTPNLMEAVALAGAEREVSSLLRDTHPMAFSMEDLDDIIAHAMPAFNDRASAILLGEKTPMQVITTTP